MHSLLPTCFFSCTTTYCMSCVGTAKRFRECCADKLIKKNLYIFANDFVLTSCMKLVQCSDFMKNSYQPRIIINCDCSCTPSQQNTFSENSIMEIALSKCDVTTLLWNDTTDHWILIPVRFSLSPSLYDVNWIRRFS